MSVFMRDYFLETAAVCLADKELWGKFARHGTEMVITKSGRNMFPHLNYKVKGLDKDALYRAYVNFISPTENRFKYTEAAGWQPAGNGEVQSSQKTVYHIESPQTGAQWEKNGINFRSLKVTNTQTAPAGQVILNSMHQYLPVLTIERHISNVPSFALPSRKFNLMETQFIAVTAYQNSDITNLKISYNKFAKGFRDEGKANTKRKRDIGLISSSDMPVKKQKNNFPSANSDGVSSPRSSPDSNSSRSESPGEYGICNLPGTCIRMNQALYAPPHYGLPGYSFPPYSLPQNPYYPLLQYPIFPTPIRMYPSYISGIDKLAFDYPSVQPNGSKDNSFSIANILSK